MNRFINSRVLTVVGLYAAMGFGMLVPKRAAMPLDFQVLSPGGKKRWRKHKRERDRRGSGPKRDPYKRHRRV